MTNGKQGQQMIYSSLVEAFEALNARKLRDPETLAGEECARWKKMRNEIEQVLFQHAPEPSADRREHLRVPVSLAVRYWTSSELKDRYIPVLGEGGLFIRTDDPLPVGEVIDLQINLARKELSLTIKGEVVWVNQGSGPNKRGMGIKFVDLTYEQKSLLYNLVCDTLRTRLLERRHFTRLDSQLPAEFHDLGGTFRLPTSDLSVGGTFVATDHLVMKGEKVKIALEVPGRKEPVRAAARVIRVIEEPQPGLAAGIGLEFVMVDPDGKQAILDHLIVQVENGAGTFHPAPGLRRKARIKRRIPVKYFCDGRWGTSFCRDISASGIFIHTHEPPRVGAKVKVDIEHPITHQHLPLAGRVVRVVPPNPARFHEVSGVGIVFTNMSQEKEHCLRSFLKEFILLEGTSIPPESDFPDEGLSVVG